MEFGLKGLNFRLLSAQTMSTHLIKEAFNWLKLGKIDAILTGGSEAAIISISLGDFCSMRIVSTAHNDKPESASRPFDATRDGFVMGNGAGVLVLEILEHAQAREQKFTAKSLSIPPVAMPMI
jgi:3-oxoacyl-[acyl-carrier-protein] synthase II